MTEKEIVERLKKRIEFYCKYEPDIQGRCDNEILHELQKILGDNHATN